MPRACAILPCPGDELLLSPRRCECGQRGQEHHDRLAAADPGRGVRGPGDQNVQAEVIPNKGNIIYHFLFTGGGVFGLKPSL